jgi:sporulation-control protein
MYNHVVATVQMGNSKADTLLEKTQFRQGETITGYICLEGGILEQLIRGIHVELVVQNRIGTRKTETVWSKVPICEQICLTPKESRLLPFKISLPEVMPISFSDRFSIFLRTQLYSYQTYTFRDNETIEILPHPHVETVFQVLTRMGFPLIWMNTNWIGSFAGCPYYQEYKFGIPVPYHCFIREFAITFLGKGQFVLELKKYREGVCSDKKFRFTINDEDFREGEKLYNFFNKVLERCIEAV